MRKINFMAGYFERTSLHLKSVCKQGGLHKRRSCHETIGVTEKPFWDLDREIFQNKRKGQILPQEPWLLQSLYRYFHQCWLYGAELALEVAAYNQQHAEYSSQVSARYWNAFPLPINQYIKSNQTIHYYKKKKEHTRIMLCIYSCKN